MARQTAEAQTDLRARRREQTRLEIIDAYADLSLDRGFNNFTMQDIADRVGISHRTLYRYFENRDAIVAGLEEELAGRVHEPGAGRFESRSEALRNNYRVFGDFRKPMLVYTLMIEAGMLSAPGRQARSDHVRAMVERAAPDLDETGRRQLVGLLRTVAGATAWARMTGPDIGLGDEEAGAASAWAVQTLIDAAARHGGDFR